MTNEENAKRTREPVTFTGYGIEADDLNWKVVKKGVNSSGKDVSTTLGYYKRLDHAAFRLHDALLKDAIGENHVPAEQVPGLLDLFLKAREQVIEEIQKAKASQ